MFFIFLARNRRTLPHWQHLDYKQKNMRFLPSYYTKIFGVAYKQLAAMTWVQSGALWFASWAKLPGTWVQSILRFQKCKISATLARVQLTGCFLITLNEKAIRAHPTSIAERQKKKKKGARYLGSGFLLLLRKTVPKSSLPCHISDVFFFKLFQRVSV